MENLDKQQGVLSSEELEKNTQYIYDFAEKIKTNHSGLAGGKGENATSRLIRDEVLTKTGEFAHLEAFGVNRLMGKGSFVVFSVVYALSLLIYFISFAGSFAAQIVLTLLSMALFICGFILQIYMLTYKFKKKHKLSTAYNVVSEIKSQNNLDDKNKQTVIIATNHSGNFGGYSLAYGKLHKTALVYMPISYVLFILFCIIKMAVGIDSVVNIVCLTVIPFIVSVLGIVATITRYSICDKRSIANNGLATSVAISTYAYFAERNELIPKNTKLVFVSFGGESDNQSGSQAFILAHPEYEGAKVLIVDDIASSELQANVGGSTQDNSGSLKLESNVNQVSEELGISYSSVYKEKLEKEIDKFYGKTQDSFNKANYLNVNISAPGKEDAIINITKNDTSNLLSLCIGIILKNFHDSEE